PNGSPLFCGSLGYGALAVTEELVREADVALAIGCRFSEFTTRRWTLVSGRTALIHADIDPDALGRYYVPAIGICADAALATAALAAAADRDPGSAKLAGRRARVAACRGAYLEQARPPVAARTTPVSSSGLVAALRTALARTNAVLVQDAPS